MWRVEEVHAFEEVITGALLRIDILCGARPDQVQANASPTLPDTSARMTTVPMWLLHRWRKSSVNGFPTTLPDGEGEGV